VVNEKRWQQLSKDIREAISKAAVEMNKIMGKGWDDHQEELSRQFAKEGMVIYRIPPEGRAAWETPLKGIEEFWIQDVEKKGLPGKKVFNDFLKIARAVAK
jgi:TRAP-type C4-dicarboxylate transport system substrate-binding protein